MYVFTHHQRSDIKMDVPIVCIFQTVPTTEDIARSATRQIPATKYEKVKQTYEDDEIDVMLEMAKTRLQKMREAGVWPSLCMLSKDETMVYAIQWIADE